MTAVATQEPGTVVRTTALLRPIAKPAAIIAAHQETVALIKEVLKEGRDYGKIPGTGDKNTLLKPGAEKCLLAFGCTASYDVETAEEDHEKRVEWTKRKKQWNNHSRGDKSFTWIEESGTSLGLYAYRVRCKVVIRDTGEQVGEGIGVCSTMEGKYVDRPRESQNTALKMGQKRALIAAVLNAFGLSDEFTQDKEEEVEEEPVPVKVEAVTEEQRRVAQFLLGLKWASNQRAWAEKQFEYAGDDGPSYQKRIEHVKAQAISKGLIPGEGTKTAAPEPKRDDSDLNEMPAALREPGE